jgi:hypothetical protein
MIGLGLGLGLGGRAGGVAVFDPATLALTGWWRADSTTGYVSGTWDGAASAGSSGSRDLTEATNPPGTGTAYGGHTAADFDGTNDRLATALTLNDFINNNAFSIGAIFEIDAAFADAGAGSRYTHPQFFTDTTDAYFGFGFSTGGVNLSCNASATERVVACGTGAIHCAQGKYDGTTLSLRVDSGARSTVLSTGPAGLAGTMAMGRNYTATNFINGRIIELYVTDLTLSDDSEDDFKEYWNARYGTSL